ncbi:MAG: AI-2E family transporter [Acidobacteria bacterium]|nr:AI-2E family transporter [Acidobacteriota bacterium]
MVKKQVTLIFLLSLTAVALYLGYIIAKPFLKPILFATVIAIVLHPVHARLHRLIRSPNVAALLSTLLSLLIIFIPTAVLGVAISTELTDLYRWLGEKSAEEGGWSAYLLHLMERPLSWIGGYVELSEFDLRAAVLGRLEATSAFLLAQVAGLVSNITWLLVGAVITFFTLFFLFREGQSVRRRAAVVLPLNPDQVERLFNGISDAIRANLYGVLAVAAAQGILTGLAFWVLGLPSPILWGLVTALLSPIPVVGSGVVWVPASIILIISGHWGKGLILLGWGAGVISMVDNIVRPYVISEQVKLHPLMVFFALLGGVKAFGMIGLFIGPIVLSITMALFSLLREEGRAWQLGGREEPPAPLAQNPVRDSRSTAGRREGS